MFSRTVINLSCQQVTSNPLDNDLDAASSDDLLLNSQHLQGIECGQDEYLAAGKIKSCEPTCQEPHPVCLRMFYTSLDHYPCFCKAPLVREPESKKCIPIKDCP